MHSVCTLSSYDIFLDGVAIKENFGPEFYQSFLLAQWLFNQAQARIIQYPYNLNSAYQLERLSSLRDLTLAILADLSLYHIDPNVTLRQKQILFYMLAFLPNVGFSTYRMLASNKVKKILELAKFEDFFMADFGLSTLKIRVVAYKYAVLISLNGDPLNLNLALW